ncbi:unnamed protein product, partial [Polarella glacialis]
VQCLPRTVSPHLPPAAVRGALPAVCSSPSSQNATRAPAPRLTAAAVASASYVVARGCRLIRRRSKGTGNSRGASLRAAVASTQAAESTRDQVVLLGDSVLDNFYWLEDPKQHLRVQLEEELRASRNQKIKALACVNLAVDQMTTFDFIERKAAQNPWEPFAAARKLVGFEDPQDEEYVVGKDGSIRSVKNLKRLKAVRWAVLSLGGNDVYLNSQVQTSLLTSLLPPFKQKRVEVAEAFGQRLRKAVAELRKAAPEAALVLVIPYQPHKDFSLLLGAPINAEGERIAGDFTGDIPRNLERQNLSDLVTPMIKEILATAREVGCAVVDLSRTLDPECEEHYGTGEIGRVNALGAPWSGAEPSNLSSGFIAKLLVHAIDAGPSPVVYRGVPRREGSGWSLLVKEENNDFILAEDYRFGGTGRKAEEVSSESNVLWFGIGI